MALLAVLILMLLLVPAGAEQTQEESEKETIYRVSVLASVTEEDGQPQSFDYDENGLLIAADGQEFSYQEDGNITPEASWQLSWDEKGRVEALADDEYLYDFDWKQNGRLGSAMIRTENSVCTFTYRYDLHGNVRRVVQETDGETLLTKYRNTYEGDLLVQRKNLDTKKRTMYEYRTVEITGKTRLQVKAQQAFLLNHPDLPMISASLNRAPEPENYGEEYRKIQVEIPVLAPGRTYSFTAYYSDEFFLADADKEQPRLAWLSALATAAVYETGSGDTASDVLASCGFDVMDGFLFSKDGTADGISTEEDNDHAKVQYGFRIIQNGEENVLAAAVVINGYTDDQYEWISNFNLGDGTVAEGFGQAAEEVTALTLEKAREYADASGKEISRCCFWIMGHSRGGAVSNLAGAALSEQYGQENVYVYTFAAPNVSKEVKEYPNIRNYIVAEDIVPYVPPEIWGYRRNGRDIVQHVSLRSMLNYRKIEGKPYNGYLLAGLFEMGERFFATHMMTDYLAVMAKRSSL